MKSSSTLPLLFFLLSSFFATFESIAQSNSFCLRSSYMTHNILDENKGWLGDWPEPAAWSDPIVFDFDTEIIRVGVPGFGKEYKIIRYKGKEIDKGNDVHKYECLELDSRGDLTDTKCMIMLIEMFYDSGAFMETRVCVSCRVKAWNVWRTYSSIYTGCFKC